MVDVDVVRLLLLRRRKQEDYFLPTSPSNTKSTTDTPAGRSTARGGATETGPECAERW